MTNEGFDDHGNADYRNGSPELKPYYEQDGVMIYNADCREILPHVDASFLVTDPPYPNSCDHFIETVPAAREVLSNWRGITALVFWTELEKPPIRLPLVAVHIWHRTNVNGKVYEPIYHFQADGEKRRSEVKDAAAVFDGAGPGCDEWLGHPTQKNGYVMSWLVGKIRPRVTVVDPFCGVGTTLVAAKRLGHGAIGMEINERWCEVAAKRLSQQMLNFDSDVSTERQGHFTL